MWKLDRPAQRQAFERKSIWRELWILERWLYHGVSHTQVSKRSLNVRVDMTLAEIHPNDRQPPEQKAREDRRIRINRKHCSMQNHLSHTSMCIYLYIYIYTFLYVNGGIFPKNIKYSGIKFGMLTKEDCFQLFKPTQRIGGKIWKCHHATRKSSGHTSDVPFFHPAMQGYADHDYGNLRTPNLQNWFH